MAAAIAVMQHPHAEDEDEDSDYFQRITQVTAHGGDRQVSAGGVSLMGETVPAASATRRTNRKSEANRWTQLSPSGSAPSPRSSSVAAYSDSAGGLLVFGGWDGSSLNDLHLYETEANRWTQLSPSGSAPSPRYQHVAAYSDSAGGLLVFGGYDGSVVENGLHLYEPQTTTTTTMRATTGTSTSQTTSTTSSTSRTYTVTDPGTSNSGTYTVTDPGAVGAAAATGIPWHVLAAEKCPDHQYLHKSTLDCQDCPDGKDPNEERDACEDETSFGLTEIQWAAVAVGLSVMGGCLAWLKWGFKSPCKKLGVNLDKPEWCCSPSQKKLDQSVAEPSLRSSAEPGEDPEAGPGPTEPPESDPGATRQ